MSETKTVLQWLALPDDKLPVELGRVFTPEPWKHDLGGYTANYCFKCGQYKCDPDSSCPVPDPIKLDWNTAMKWRDKIFAGRYSTEFATRLLEVFGGGVEGDIDECFAKATYRDYLITAAMVVERKTK